MLQREYLQTMYLGQTDSELGSMQTQVIALLTKHMKQYLFSVSKDSRMSSNVSVDKFCSVENNFFSSLSYHVVVHC